MHSQNGLPKMDHRCQGELAVTGVGLRVLRVPNSLVQPDDEDYRIESILDIIGCLTVLGVRTRLRSITGAA